MRIFLTLAMWDRWDTAAPNAQELLGDARIAVQRSVLAQARVFVDLIQGRSRQRPVLQRGQERDRFAAVSQLAWVCERDNGKMDIQRNSSARSKETALIVVFGERHLRHLLGSYQDITMTLARTYR
jgi:hypothetical protein